MDRWAEESKRSQEGDERIQNSHFIDFMVLPQASPAATRQFDCHLKFEFLVYLKECEP